MTLRNPNQPNEIEQFANDAFFDLAFPKQSQDFDEISKYLEEMPRIFTRWRFLMVLGSCT